MEDRIEFTDAEKAQGFRITGWKGLKNFECGRCAYSTLWSEKMKDHISKGNHPHGMPGGPFIVDEPVNNDVSELKDATY